MLDSYSGHNDNIFALAWSPSGTLIASAGRDHTLQLWQPTDGTLCATFRHAGPILSLAWTSNGAYLACSNTLGQIAIYAAASLDLIKQYQIHRRFVRCLAWSPDARFIVSGGDFGDSTAQVWEASTGQVRTLHTTQYRFFAVSWSPTGQFIATASFDGVVQLWQPETGKVSLTYRRHKGPVYTVAWSPDGTRIASAGEDGTAHIWSAQTGEPLVIYRGHNRAVKTLIWSPDGQTLATGGEDNVVQLWSADQGELLQRFPVQPSWIRALSGSPDGRVLAWACKNHVSLAAISTFI